MGTPDYSVHRFQVSAKAICHKVLKSGTRGRNFRGCGREPKSKRHTLCYDECLEPEIEEHRIAGNPARNTANSTLVTIPVCPSLSVNAPASHHLPQWVVLPTLVRNLYSLSPVRAIFLAGSLGRGNGDEWSDLDLQVHVDCSFRDFLDDVEIQTVTGDPPVALERFKLGPDTWMHHMILADGTLVDLLCRTKLPAEEARLWIALPTDMTSPPEAVARQPKAWAPKPIAADEVTALVSRYWIMMHKHRRGMARNQPLVIWTGVHHSIALLVRLEFIAATGQDCGDLTRMGIYDLSGVNEWMTQAGMQPNVHPFPDSCGRTDWEEQVHRLLKSGRAVTRRLMQQWVLTPDPSALVHVVGRDLAAWLTRT